MPLTETRGDGLPVAQPARHNRHHEVIQNGQITETQPIRKLWDSPVSPSGGMKDTCGREEVADRDSRSLLLLTFPNCK